MYDIAFQLLQPCINFGLEESKFWDMTVAELQRYIDGAMWRYKQKASLDYALANLIGISNARLMSSDVDYPTLEKAYPSLFADELSQAEAERIAEEKAIQNSTNRFLEFARKHNTKIRREVGEKT
jgi:hypothetical protein